MRAALAIVGVAAALWSAVSMSSFWSTSLASDASARILSNDRFKAGTLSEIFSRVQGRPTALPMRASVERAGAVIGLRLAEEEFADKGSQEADRDMAVAEEKVRSSLALSPMDSFLWLMVYSVATSRRGFDMNDVAYLEQSYATGPLESWIVLRRNKQALAIFPMLDEAMQLRAVSEFASLVNSGFIEEAALNLTGIGWPLRDRLLASLSQADIISREAFAKRLARDGIKVRVPGIEVDERPWR